MKKLLTAIILLISNYGFSQLKAVILNSETGETIPYVNIWVENESQGTTSNEKGEFELQVEGSKIIVFSSIGFKTKKAPSDSIKRSLELIPHTFDLGEVIIIPKKETQKLTIGNFKKSEINSYFGSGTKPWITARYFEKKEEYDKTPFLNKIKLLTKSEVRDSKFNIRLYNVNSKGEPADFIFDENIIAIAGKGKKITEIDLSALNIKFPENGFFIAVEWLIIESNKYEFTYTIESSKKKLNGISYNPGIGTVPAETDENSWIFSQGKWSKVWKNNNDTFKSYKDKYTLLAIELTLTD